MSARKRTNKFPKGWGWDCWSRRPHAGYVHPHDRSSLPGKRLALRAERRIAKRELRKDLDE